MIALLLAAALQARAAGVAVSTAPAALSTEDRRRALLLTDLLVEEERWDEAESYILERRSADPAPADWTLRLARLRSAQRRYADAATLYRELLTERADDGGLLLQLGNQAQAAGDLATARTAFERAAKLSKGPEPRYYLAEYWFGRGGETKGRSYAREALAGLKRPVDLQHKRMRLRMLWRLGRAEGLEDQYGRLFDENPTDSELLSDWASAMTRTGAPDAAREPIALLRERFPKQALTWRQLEAERLRRAGDEAGLRRHLEESARALPAERSLRLELAALELSDRRWPAAERDGELASDDPLLFHPAREIVNEARRSGWHHLGPSLAWRDSDGSRAVEEGVVYGGYPLRRLRVDAEADRGVYEKKNGGRSTTISGGLVTAGYERGDWTVGADFDARAGSGLSAASPGLFARWRRGDVTAAAHASARRAWTTSTDAALAGALGDEVDGKFYYRVARRLLVGGTARGTRYTAGGGAGRQSILAPEASWTLLDRPFYAAVGWRFVSQDATGDDSFFLALPLLRRARTHYGLLVAGKQWLDGNLRSDGYVFNGHDPERGHTFGAASLIGYGLNVEWMCGHWRLTGSFEDSLEVVGGVGGRNRAVKALAQYRWAPRRTE